MQNRIYKFRAWNKGRKEMAYLNGSDWLANFWQTIETDPDNFEVMQYTGLKDKNGKEIYEGDIMRVLDRHWSDMERYIMTYIVYYAQDSFVLTTKEGIKERESDSPNQYNKDWIEAKLSRTYGRDRFEIIGNIYENLNLSTSK